MRTRGFRVNCHLREGGQQNPYRYHGKKRRDSRLVPPQSCPTNRVHLTYLGLLSLPDLLGASASLLSLMVRHPRRHADHLVSDQGDGIVGFKLQELSPPLRLVQEPDLHLRVSIHLRTIRPTSRISPPERRPSKRFQPWCWSVLASPKTPMSRWTLSRWALSRCTPDSRSRCS